MSVPAWFNKAVAYEVYPQSFLDTNGDGIGDLNGVTAKLDYIRGLGCDTIWLNPIYLSPFQDGGYDVIDHCKVAPRYGTEEDLIRLFNEAHKRNMHILLDLVPGHTSRQHPWFLDSQRHQPEKYADRYIWTDNAFNKPSNYAWICGSVDRNGCAMINFFDMQPALNYGFNRITHPWQMSWQDPRVQGTMDDMIGVMRYWLQRGADGFRVDMADSLVKNDDDKEATCAVWRRAMDVLHREYPAAVMVSEWCTPERAINLAGFTGDFWLQHENPHDNGYHTLMRDGEHAYFRKEAKGDLSTFLAQYGDWYGKTKGRGHICFITGNHDCRRASLNLDESELKMAYSFLLTLPGVPFIYMGDEIGARHLNLPSKEGGFDRTGDRTPMQWDHTAQYGFSTNPDIYVAQNTAPDAPTVADQEADENSLLNHVKRVLAFRNAHADLDADAPFEPVWMGERGYAFVYRRGNLLLAINPAADARAIPFPVDAPLFLHGGADARDGETLLHGQSFVIWQA